METVSPSLLAGLPPLLAELRAAAEKRLTTPTSQCVGPVLGPVTMTEADCEEADMAIHRWKMAGGPARDNQAQAEKLDRQHGPSMRLAGWWL